MAQVLFDNGQHQCIAFTDLVDEEAAVQANQFLIIDDGQGILLDPGGNLVYKQLFSQMSEYVSATSLRYIMASHADPDIISCLNGLLLMTDANVLIASEWKRFLPHFCQKGVHSSERLVEIDASGVNILLGQSVLNIVPAHYLHTVGNFHLYDPVSKLYFSGDLGSSFCSVANLPGQQNNISSVVDFTEFAEQNGVKAFFQRFMAGNKVAGLWVNMLRTLDIEGIVPQHGTPYLGRGRVDLFLSWVESMDCGLDLL